MAARGEMARLKRQHRRKSEDALVSIDGARVRAAIEWKGLSVNGAAAKLRIKQQTLDSIVRSQTKRCYASLRDKLARLVDLPATWLGGETDRLPSLTPWLPHPGLGYEPPLWVDENLRLVRPPGEGEHAALPPRYQLAAYELCGQIVTAWRRDIDRGDRKAKAALSRLAVGEWKKNPWNRAMMLVTRFVSAVWWRRLLLDPPPLLEPVDPTRFTDGEWEALSKRMIRQNLERAANQLAAYDRFAVAAASAMATTLEPWFSDEQELNYEHFVGALEWASRGFGKDPSQGGD